MNEQERLLATNIWPDKMQNNIGLANIQNIHQHEFPYQSKVEAAKAWLGDRYLLAPPIVKRRK